MSKLRVRRLVPSVEEGRAQASARIVAQPDGLAGEDIPHESRIILACNAGTQFDVRIAEALVGRLDGRREPGLAAVDS